MVNDLIEVIRKLASSSAPETVVPNDRTNAIDHISTSTQNSIKLAAKIGNAIEAGEEKGWDIDNQESLIQLYNSISGDRVKIRLTSRSDKPYKYMSFDVKGSDKSAIKGLSIGYYDHNGRLSDMRNSSTIGITISGFGRPNLRLGTFESGDKNYKLWSSIFNKARDVKHATYEDKQFLNLVLSSLRDAMIDAIGTSTSTETTITESPEEILETSANIFNTQASVSQEVTETTPTVGKSTSTEAIPHDDPNNGITTKNTVFHFSFGNRPKNVLERPGPVLNISDVGYEPTAIPATEEQDTGMSAEEMANWVAGGGLGLMAVGVGYCRYKGNKKGKYKVKDTDNEKPNLFYSTVQSIATAMSIMTGYFVERCTSRGQYDLARKDQENPHISKTISLKTVRSLEQDSCTGVEQPLLSEDSNQTKPKTLANTLKVHAEINNQMDEDLVLLSNSLATPGSLKDVRDTLKTYRMAEQATSEQSQAQAESTSSAPSGSLTRIASQIWNCEEVQI